MGKREAEMSSFEKYVEIKKTHPNMVVLVFDGENYISYMFDSLLLYEECDCELSMKPAATGLWRAASFPKTKLDSILSHLMKSSYKVAICEN